jgi:predicted TIM-barrel fold metal-dependent hydrolase
VTSLIERFPNLYFDLASPQAKNVYKPSGARDGTLYEFPSGDLKQEWRRVIETHPERFLMASDYRPQVEQFYPMLIRFQRKLLDELSPTVRARIGYQNAWRLITGTAWT